MSYQLPFEINIYCFHIVLNSSVAHTVETSEALFSVASQPQKIPLGWVPKTYLAIEVIVIMISLGLLTECDHVAGYQKSYEIWSQNNHLFALWPWAGDLTFLTPLNFSINEQGQVLLLVLPCHCVDLCSPHWAMWFPRLPPQSLPGPESYLGRESCHLCVPMPSTEAGKEQRAGVLCGWGKERKEGEGRREKGRKGRGKYKFSTPLELIVIYFNHRLA